MQFNLDKTFDSVIVSNANDSEEIMKAIKTVEDKVSTFVGKNKTNQLFVVSTGP